MRDSSLDTSFPAHAREATGGDLSALQGLEASGIIFIASGAYR